MSYPILYSATETNFDHNGIGILSACVSCEVTEEANGIFELTMQYPMDGVHFAEIGDRAVIKAKADQFRDPQLFRVYAISKPMNGIVTVLAEHISYDLSGIPVKPFSASTASSALTGLKNNAVVDCPFTFWTDKGTSANFNVSTPASIRSRLGGVAGSILEVYGGEYEFDNYTVKLHNSRGQNRGVSIRYGKNLTDIQQDQNCSNIATGVYPYWYLETDVGNVLIELPEKIVPAPGTYNFVKIRTLDLSAEFDVQPTHEQLRAKAQQFINANKIGVPVVSLTVSFAQLEQTEEYKHLKLLERVSLFDTVNVEFPALKVSATAKAVKMVYDVIADRVKSVTLGSVRANIADTIASQQKDITKVSKDKLSVSLVQKISSAIAKEIMGANGGSVRLIDTNDDGEPDELYIADNADPAQAVKVWRFNYNGWAASKNGYAGPFEFGATLEDGLLANFVTAAQLVAGTIKSQDDGKTFFLDLDKGVLHMSASSFNISGKTVDEIAQNAASSVTVGGTNLLVGTKDFSGSNWRNIEMWSSDGEYKGFVVKTYSGQWQGLCQELSASAGEVYTMSAYIKSSGNFHFYPNIGNMGTGAADVNTLSWFGETPGWARISATFTVSQDGTLTPGFETLEDSQLWICGMKLEKGNKATDWSPSPEDQNAYADTAAEQAVSNQTQQDIFNKLTNKGTLPGLFMSNGQLYINASYLKSGTINANDVTVENLSASSIKSGKLVSKNGLTSFDLSTGEIRCANESFSTETVIDEGSIAFYSNGQLMLEVINTLNTCSVLFYDDTGNISTIINDFGDGLRIGTGGISCRAFWKANLDGTFTLMGSED